MRKTSFFVIYISFICKLLEYSEIWIEGGDKKSHDHGGKLVIEFLFRIFLREKKSHKMQSRFFLLPPLFYATLSDKI